MGNRWEHSHMQHQGHHAAHAGHDRHAGHSVAMFRDKFWLSLALTIPVVFWSSEVQHWLGYTAPTFPGSKFIPAILGTVVFLYGGIVFIRGAWSELSDRRPGMMTLISLGQTSEEPIWSPTWGPTCPFFSGQIRG
jgi:Cu2+-exporting ATPase